MHQNPTEDELVIQLLGTRFWEFGSNSLASRLLSEFSDVAARPLRDGVSYRLPGDRASKDSGVERKQQ
jgi:hypothetical protein